MKILFFSPHSALWVHAFPEALVAEALKQGGHDIVYVGCGRTFSRGCVCMSAQHVGADSGEVDQLGPKRDEDARLTVCNTSRRYKNTIREQFEFWGYAVDGVFPPADMDEAE